MSIRAFDYLPPFDITFGDYLRALVTADQIRPALERCARCRKGEREHARADHDYSRDFSLP
jgi:hypothetical protein